jgi:hypothetical protein
MLGKDGERVNWCSVWVGRGLVEVGCPEAEGGVCNDVVVTHAHDAQLLQ